MLASIFNVTSWSKLAAGAPTIVSELRAVKKKKAKKKKKERERERDPFLLKQLSFEEPSWKSHTIYISLETWDLAVLESEGNGEAMWLSKIQVLIIRSK